MGAQDLIATPAFRVMTAADEFHDKTTAPNQLWQTGFTYLKVIGWPWPQQDLIQRRSGIGRAYCLTTAQVISPTNWETGSKTSRWSMPAVRLTTR